MPWNSLYPEGAKSVKDNVPLGNQNTTYTETELNKDHYWNIGVNEDGRHKWVNTVATNDVDPTIATNAPLAAGMDLLYFSRLKTATEATTAAARNCQPFVKNLSPVGEITPWSAGVMQLLGIRAMALFNPVAGNVAQTLVYSHNVTSVIRQTAGRYSINFTNAMPSDDYLILGGGISSVDIDTPCLFSASGTTLGNKNVNQAIFILKSGVSTANNDILQGWIICFGG